MRKKRITGLVLAMILLLVTAAACGEAGEEEAERNEAIRIAAEAIRTQYPDVNPLDEAEYTPETCRAGEGEYLVTFRTRNVLHGDASAAVSPDRTAYNVTADTEEPDGDGLFLRYRAVYGWFGDWNQERWVQLGKDMQALDPREAEGWTLKATRYPEENTVRIGNAEARELALRAVGDAGLYPPEVNTCVLADADPHPVWIMRVLTYSGEGEEPDPVVGIDAETGETVFIVRYYVDETPHYIFWSTPETWRVYTGAVALARKAVVFRYADRDLDDPDTDVYNEEDWDTEQEGLTVRFTGRWKGMKAYEVELDGNGSVLRCEQSGSPSDAEKPAGEREEEDSPIPTPQPDGTPWIWGSAFAPAEYWERLSAVMEENGVTFDNLKEKVFEWSQEYGELGDEGNWPQDRFMIGYVLTQMIPEELEWERVRYPVFADPEKKSKEEIEAIAWEAFHEAADPEGGAGRISRMRAASRLMSDGIYEYFGVAWDAPAWYVYFMEMQDCWENKGLVMLDEDGNILTVQVDLEGSG